MPEDGPSASAGLSAELAADAPFTDPSAVASLYVTADRLARRTGALRAARVAGRPADEVIADLAARLSPGEVVADVGCGRGSTTVRLAERLRPRVLLAVDRAHALLDVTRERTAGVPGVRLVQADFHRLPLPNDSLDLVVAAFCLYHSPRPPEVIAELARCLAPGGTAILATKSADSYRALDELVATSGLDPHAATRPSLYATAHSGNLSALARDAMEVTTVVHEAHRFRFTDLTHTCAYLATSPKYRLPDHLDGRPDAMAEAVRARLPDGPVTVTSTVTYVVARRAPTLVGG